MFEFIINSELNTIIITVALILGLGNLFISLYFKYKRKKTIEKIHNMTIEELDEFIEENSEKEKTSV